ncbi:MAG: type II secretion system protein [bacterium]|nr:type II secretion system protein [bacterium]
MALRSPKDDEGFTTFSLHERGFTLIELLLASSVIGAMLFVVSGFLVLILQSRAKHEAMIEVESQGMQAVYAITQSIRNADAIINPALASNSTSLSLDMESLNVDPTVFSVSANTLRITEGSGSPVALTNSRVVASGLQFDNLSKNGTPGTIRVQLTLSKVLDPEGRQENAFTKTFFGSATIR